MNSTNGKPRLTLVGAGPGDPELITLKGIRAISSADYILYDALVSKELLDNAKASATIIFVGKRSGNHKYAQEEINEMIVLLAGHDKHVVRLKGGDPYVFGRGYEELEFAEQHGLEVDVIPGISSAVAVPSLAGIPLTRRGVSESFWVVTGTTRRGALSNDIRLVAQSSATAVVLMGMSKLAEIMDVFTWSGKANTAVAIIQNGSTPDEKLIKGKVNDIVDKASDSGIGSPAIIVIGEVADLKEEAIATSLKRNKLLVA